jgi:predicted Zn finger-like uncharacterized protein
VQFSCDSCKTLLQIADEKVRGKRLVVRCKRCGAKITISDPLLANKLTRVKPSVPAPMSAPAPAPAAPAPAQTAPVTAPASVAPEPAAETKRDSDTENTVAMDSDLLERAVQASKSENPEQVLAVSRPPPPAADQAIWFAMLQGKQVGPLTRGDLSGRATSGEVGPRTYLWKEGMDSWQRARDVAELSALFPLPAPAPATIPPPPVQTPDPASSETLPEANARSIGGDGFDGDARSIGGEESATNPDMMPLGEQVHQDEVAQQLFTSGDHGPSSPNSAADLASWANSDLGKPSNPGVAKARPAPVAAESSRPKPTPVPVPVPPQPAARMFESAAPPRSRVPLVLFILALLAAAAVAVWVYMGIEKNPAGAPPQPAETPDAAVAAPPPAPPKPLPIETAAVPAAGLSAEQVRKKLDENRANLQTCIDDALKRDPNLRVGRIHLTTTIAPSGQVSATKIDKRPVDESALGICLKRTTGKLVFPSFQGKPFDVDIPITVGE